MNNAIEPINIDMVRRLRAEGKYIEAQNLVNKHQESLRESWVLGKKEVVNVTSRKRNFLLKKNHPKYYVALRHYYKSIERLNKSLDLLQEAEGGEDETTEIE